MNRNQVAFAILNVLLWLACISGCSKSGVSTANSHSVLLEHAHSNGTSIVQSRAVPIAECNLTQTSWPEGQFDSLEVSWDRMPEIRFHEVWVGYDSPNSDERRLVGYTVDNKDFVRASYLNNNHLVLTVNLRDVPSSNRERICHVTLINRMDTVRSQLDQAVQFAGFVLEDGQLSESYAAALNHRAWHLATFPVAAARNGTQAVNDARESCRHSGWKVHSYVDTLAAAFAEVGDFAQAVQIQQKAIALVPATEPESARSYRKRLSDYERRTPFREWTL